MSGVEASAVVTSAAALLMALVLAVLWRRSRRELRELRSAVDHLARQQSHVVVGPSRPVQGPPPTEPEPVPADLEPVTRPSRADAIVTADGRTIVVPTTAQVVDATMGRPLVRASALAHGLRRALQPGNRDRIRAMMRREYQRRRKMRQRAARRAARMAPVHQTEEGT